MTTSSGKQGKDAPTPDDRLPRAQLRHWSSYATASAYWADHRGYVPIQMMVGISRVQRERGCSFAEAYALLLAAGAIIHIDDESSAADAGSSVLGQ